MIKQYIIKPFHDFESLKKILEDMGMVDIKRYDWRKTEHGKFDDHSQSYLPHMEKERGTLIMPKC